MMASKCVRSFFHILLAALRLCCFTAYAGKDLHYIHIGHNGGNYILI